MLFSYFYFEYFARCFCSIGGYIEAFAYKELFADEAEPLPDTDVATGIVTIEIVDLQRIVIDGNTYIYLAIAVVALTTYLVRVLPLTLIRKEIKNPFIRSFLYYVPYVTLAVMTFPAIIYATDSIWSGIAALVVGILVAWFSGNLFLVALSACAVVFIVEMLIF